MDSMRLIFEPPGRIFGRDPPPQGRGCPGGGVSEDPKKGVKKYFLGIFILGPDPPTNPLLPKAGLDPLYMLGCGGGV